jgi:UDP-4-amino-4,6-dideoxy-N-acetyl-beta-L-altrosamine N-acetyltransferase
MTLADTAQVLEWRNQPDIARNMFDDRPIDPDRHAAWVRSAVASPAHRYWIIEHDGVELGVANLAGIDIRNRRCSWAFYIADPKYRGPVGVAVELRILEIVFAEMGLEKLSGEVLAFNERTIALHERLGFSRGGVLRSHVWRADGPHDVVVLSMLRSDWEARYGAKYAMKVGVA